MAGDFLAGGSGVRLPFLAMAEHEMPQAGEIWVKRKTAERFPDGA